MKLTRRNLAATLVSATALSAQQTQPAPAAPDDLQTARNRLKANAAALDALPLSMATEPAFQFKA
jgi:hypothetical protein